MATVTQKNKDHVIVEDRCENCWCNFKHLPTHCPPFPVSKPSQKMIKHKKIDFIDGRWKLSY